MTVTTSPRNTSHETQQILDTRRKFLERIGARETTIDEYAAWTLAHTDGGGRFMRVTDPYPGPFISRTRPSRNYTDKRRTLWTVTNPEWDGRIPQLPYPFELHLFVFPQLFDLKPHMLRSHDRGWEHKPMRWGDTTVHTLHWSETLAAWKTTTNQKVPRMYRDVEPLIEQGKARFTLSQMQGRVRIIQRRNGTL